MVIEPSARSAADHARPTTQCDTAALDRFLHDFAAITELLASPDRPLGGA